MLDPFPNVVSWIQRMMAFGHGNVTHISGDAALDIASKAEPLGDEMMGSMHPSELKPGDDVEIIPTDYGLIPVQGKLQIASLEELAIRRTDARVGNISVHFPRLGFELRRH